MDDLKKLVLEIAKRIAADSENTLTQTEVFIEYMDQIKHHDTKCMLNYLKQYYHTYYIKLKLLLLIK